MSSDPDGASTTATTDDDLLPRLRQGDQAAYEELIRRYGPRLLSTAKRFVGQESDAQDVLQEAFLAAFKALPNFHADSSLYTWLHRITVNAALMRLRKEKRRGEKSIDDLLPRNLDDAERSRLGEGWRVSKDDALESREVREFVRNAIEQLPENFRSVLLLRDIEGFSTEEAATALDLTPGAVKTRLHRARLALKNLLDPVMYGGDAR